MKFINLNKKSTLIILAIILTINLSFIISNENVSSVSTQTKSEIKSNTEAKIKTDSKMKNTNTNKSSNTNKNLNTLKSNLKTKSKSKISSKKKTYSFQNPPGSTGAEPLNPKTPTFTGRPPKSPQVPNPEPPKLITPAPPKGQTQTTATGTPKGTGAIPQPPVIRPTKGQGDVILNDWLKISSKTFHNRYGEIDMGYHGDNISIRTDSYEFRINDAFGKDKNKDNQPPNEELFWFRMTKDLIFYSSTKHDLNLLGGMRINEIVDAEGEKTATNGDYCFFIQDISKHDWEICSVHEKVRNGWFCKIQELRKETKPAYCYEDDENSKTKVIVKNVRK